RPHQSAADPGRGLVRRPHPRSVQMSDPTASEARRRRSGLSAAEGGTSSGRRAEWRCLAAGLVVLAVAIVALERVSETSFTWHMIQHTLLIVVAAPLLALGAPSVLARLPARWQRAAASIAGPS